MKIRDIIGALELFAPLSLQDGFDNAGLQIGLTEDAEASGALLCLDVTEDVLDEAKRKGLNLVVSHHPLLFHPLKRIADDDEVQRCVIKAIQSGITVYSAHTNLDNAPEGVNRRIAELLGLVDCRPLEPKHLPAPWEQAGAGLVGTLPQAMAADAFMAMVKERFAVGCVRHNQWTGKAVQRVALCGGAAAFLIPRAVEAGADVFLTGEIGYHRFFGYDHQLLLMEIGHYESEQFTIDLLHDIIAKACPDLPVVHTSVVTNPIRYI